MHHFQLTFQPRELGFHVIDLELDDSGAIGGGLLMRSSDLVFAGDAEPQVFGNGCWVGTEKAAEAASVFDY